LTVTHFSFFPPWTVPSSDFSDSSSDVTLSSVSASIPVLLTSDSELEDDDSLDVAVSVEVSVETAASVAAAEATSVAVEVGGREDSLLKAASARKIFLALARASFLSSFCKY
jgi:hypothetical protein